jgi:hypothetical protein
LTVERERQLQSAVPLPPSAPSLEEE